MRQKKTNQHVIEAVLRLWDVGMDTESIKTVLDIKQDEAERCLHQGLEQRKQNAREATDV